MFLSLLDSERCYKNLNITFTLEFTPESLFLMETINQLNPERNSFFCTNALLHLFNCHKNHERVINQCTTLFGYTTQTDFFNELHTILCKIFPDDSYLKAISIDDLASQFAGGCPSANLDIYFDEQYNSFFSKKNFEAQSQLYFTEFKSVALAIMDNILKTNKKVTSKRIQRHYSNNIIPSFKNGTTRCYQVSEDNTKPFDELTIDFSFQSPNNTSSMGFIDIYCPDEDQATFNSNINLQTGEIIRDGFINKTVEKDMDLIEQHALMLFKDAFSTTFNTSLSF